MPDAPRPLDEPDSVEPGSDDRDGAVSDLDDIALDDTALDDSATDEGDLEATVVREVLPVASGADSGSAGGADSADLAETVLRVMTVESPHAGVAQEPRASVAPRGAHSRGSDENEEGLEPSRDADDQAPAPHRVARIRIGSTVLELTVPAIIGRRPTAPRVAAGAAPTLVPVASPKLEISAAHLSLRQSGRVVVATDLHSRNGTRVSIPGAAPRLLCGGDSVVVSTGSILDLGEDVRVEVLTARVGGEATANGAGS